MAGKSWLQVGWLKTRREYWKEMHSHPIFKGLAVMWFVFGAVSLFIPFWPKKSEQFYDREFFPQWHWYVWVIGLLILAMIAIFEGGHTQVQTYKRRAEEIQNDLRQRVLDLGRDLFSFLREVGPKPSASVDKSKSTEEKVMEFMEVNGPYVDKVHYGYLKKFKTRAIELFIDLKEAHIPYALKEWEIDPPQAVRAETVKKIAEKCFHIATRMDIEAESKGT